MPFGPWRHLIRSPWVVTPVERGTHQRLAEARDAPRQPTRQRTVHNQEFIVPKKSTVPKWSADISTGTLCLQKRGEAFPVPLRTSCPIPWTCSARRVSLWTLVLYSTSVTDLLNRRHALTNDYVQHLPTPQKPGLHLQCSTFKAGCLERNTHLL